MAVNRSTKKSSAVTLSMIGCCCLGIVLILLILIGLGLLGFFNRTQTTESPRKVKAAGAHQALTFPPKARVDQVKAAICLDDWMTSQVPSSPLIGKGARFMTSGKANDVNPALMAAIGSAESSLGTTGGGVAVNNPFGLMQNGASLIAFPSWEASIDYVAKHLHDNYVGPPNNLITIPQIGAKYAPVGAGNDPQNLNSNWVSNVTTAFNSILNRCPEFSEIIGTADPSYNADCGQKLVAYAKEQLGKPYVFSACGPNSFDCSGLVKAAANAAGITDVPRLADAQADPSQYSSGRAVIVLGPIGTFANGPDEGPVPLNPAQLQAGDLVFFHSSGENGKNGIGHVGIFTGEDSDHQMIHAPRTGDVVRYASINPRIFRGAVRICTGGGGKKAKGTPTLDSLNIDWSQARNLTSWKPQIQAYSKKHYGEDTWQLSPTVIVEHFTAGTGFPSNLVNSTSFDGEPPGLASHFVVDGNHIWGILPTNVRSRGAYAINHRAINIEMVAASASDLANRTSTLRCAAALTAAAMNDLGIPSSKVYSHTRVGNKQVPEFKDLVDSRPYGKPDPGENNLATIKNYIQSQDYGCDS